MNENLSTVYEAIADALPDERVVTQGSRRYTWRELDERAARLAGHFEAAGLGPGDAVIIFLHNSPEYVETVIGACKARVVPTSVNYRASAKELIYFLEKSSARGIVFHQSLGKTVAEAKSAYPDLKDLVCVADGSNVAPPAGSVDYATTLAATKPAPRRRRSGDDNLIMFTGGTTGMPKAVLWRHRDIIALLGRNLGNPQTPADFVALARKGRAEGTAPFSFVLPPLMHSTGLFNTIGTLMQGGQVLFSESRSLDPDLALREARRERVKSMVIVGDVFARPLIDALRRLPESDARDSLASLKSISSVGVRWSADAKADILAFGDMTLSDVLASSEGGAVAISETNKTDGQVKTRFELLPHAWLLGEDGKRVEPRSGQTGMVVSGGVLPDGYLGEIGYGTSGTFRAIDGKNFVVTGDFACAEADGSYTLIGRGSSVINTGGEKVFADEVETVIASHPAVEDVIVAGVPDTRWGHLVGAVVALRQGHSIKEGELADHVGAELAGYKKPRHIRFVERIERKATGKADRQWAAALLSEGRS